MLAAAFGQPADQVLATMEERDLLPFLADSERELLAEPDEDRRTQMSWRTECLYALGWTLGVYDALPLAGLAEPSPEDFAALDPEAEAGTPADVALRDERELMTRLDAFYCAHWAARDHGLTGLPDTFPEDVVEGAVRERRHALEWLLSDAAWDDVDLST